MTATDNEATAADGSKQGVTATATATAGEKEATGSKTMITLPTDKEAAAADGSKQGATATAGEEAATGSKTMITLKSKEGNTFDVSEAGARLSSVLGKVIDSKCDTSNGIELPEVGAAALEKVVEYLEKHAGTAPDDEGTVARFMAVRARAVEDLEKWDADLFDGVVRGSQDALFDLIDAATYLDVDGLLDAGCRKIADMMRGKRAEQIRRVFNIQYDYTKEEEEEVFEECAWAFFPRVRSLPPAAAAAAPAPAANDDGDGDNGDEDDDEEEEDENDGDEEEEVDDDDDEVAEAEGDDEKDPAAEEDDEKDPAAEEDDEEDEHEP